MNAPYSRRFEFPHMPRDGWRRKAVCPSYLPDLLWDDRVDGESEEERRERHDRASQVCRYRCPVRAECSADADWRIDSGIRGGHKIPSQDGHLNRVDTEMLRLLKKGCTLDEAALGAGCENSA